jgi:hypothetical protein
MDSRHEAQELRETLDWEAFDFLRIKSDARRRAPSALFPPTFRSHENLGVKGRRVLLPCKRRACKSDTQQHEAYRAASRTYSALLLAALSRAPRVHKRQASSISRYLQNPTDLH